jgi:hypothetical protein
MNRRIAAIFFVAVFAISLAACSSRAGTPWLTSGVPAGAPPTTHTQTFKYKGKRQSFTVPPGINNLTVTVYGATGANGGRSSHTFPGGRGGKVGAIIPVTPGEVLAIYVGGSNGWNGGGSGQGTSGPAASGGGASDVRQSGNRLRDRVIIAGGGGGAGGNEGYGNVTGGAGGVGGGKLGGSGQNGGMGSTGAFGGSGGSGGTQSAGGSGGGGGGGSASGCYGKPGANGALGVGGAPGTVCADGGGGGGGHYGGGGGGGGGAFCTPEFCAYSGGGGGGGGSSYIEPNATKLLDIKGGAPRGDGRIVISW